MSHAVAPVGKEVRWRGDDFPAWLSPMLVKELRQGIQSGAFAWTFVGLQVSMFLLMAWTVNFAEQDRGFRVVEFMTAMFWFAVGVAMVVVIPLRGLGAVAAERAGNNLDLVRLTHLSATRIVAGKWLAIVAQAVLLASAILPYLVLRYFLGGVDVLADLKIFGWLTAASMTVAAVAVALSTLPLWMRIGAGIAVVMTAFPVAGLIDDYGFPRLFAPAGAAPLASLGAIAIMAVYVAACLEFAAGRIAAAAENHSARKRLLALGIAAAWMTLAWRATDDAAFVALIAGGPLLLAYGVGALVERPSQLATVYAPFARRGAPGRLAAALLAPGWATGLLFLAVEWGLFMAGWLGILVRLAHRSDRDLLSGTTLGCLLAATIVFPLPLLVYLPRTKLPLLLYALAQLACFLVFVYSGVAWSGTRRWEQSWGWTVVLPFPLAGLLSFAGGPYSAEGMAAFAPSFLTAALATVAAVLAAVARPWIREFRAMGRLLSTTPEPGRS